MGTTIELANGLGRIGKAKLRPARGRSKGLLGWLGGDAIGHVRQMVIAGNYAPGNAGPWLWSDVLVPLILVVTLFPARNLAASLAEATH